jgi:(p)ppGpp synthase/HD superfamily hydrolase
VRDPTRRLDLPELPVATGKDRPMSETPKTEPKWPPSEKFYAAFRKACEGHKEHVRKGSDIPYIGHLLGVASAVIEAGGCEDQAIAAFLHDMVEDTDVSVAEIKIEFGETVSEIVDACTDATKAEKDAEKKELTDATQKVKNNRWWARKKKYIDELSKKTMDDTSVLVALADKTYNAENTAADLRDKNKNERKKVWSKFNVGEKLQRKWYRGLLKAFKKNKTYDKFSQPLFNRFEAAVNEIFPNKK